MDNCGNDLKLQGGESWDLNVFWLRDNCRCEKCFDAGMLERRTKITEISPELEISRYDWDLRTLRIVCEYPKRCLKASFNLLTLLIKGTMDMNRRTTRSFYQNTSSNRV